MNRRDTYTPDPTEEKLKKALRDADLAGDWRDSDHNDRFDYMKIEELVEEYVKHRINSGSTGGRD